MMRCLYGACMRSRVVDFKRRDSSIDVDFTSFARQHAIFMTMVATTLDIQMLMLSALHLSSPRRVAATRRLVIAGSRTNAINTPC